MIAWVWILGGLYLALLAYIAIFTKQQNENANDYILAGSNVNAVVGFLAYSATLFSAFTLMGMPDFFRTHGIGAWIFLAVSDGAQIFLIVWFGYLLRRRAREHNFQGMAGMLNTIYQSRVAGYVYFAGVFLFLVPYVAIQIRGVSIFLEAVFPGDLPAWVWSTAVVAVMLAYSTMGGLRAVLITDVVQGLILLAAVWIVAAGCINYFGSVGAMFEQVQQVNEELLSVPGPEGLFTTQFLLISFISVMLLPATQPQLTARLVIMESTKKMNRMAVAIGIFMLLILLPVIAIGLYGVVRYPDAPAREFIANALLFDQAGIVAAMAVVGLLAAAMSTAAAQIFALSTELRSLSRGNEETVMRLTKGAIIVFGVAALIFSVVSSDQLVLLALASFRGTALLGPLVLAAVVSRRPLGREVAFATAAALLLFLASLAGWVPAEAGPLRTDLLLFFALGVITFGSVRYRRRG